MALHPQCKSFLDLLAAAGGRPLQNLTPQEARQMVLPADLGGPEAPMHRVDDRRPDLVVRSRFVCTRPWTSRGFQRSCSSTGAGSCSGASTCPTGSAVSSPLWRDAW